MHFRFSAHKCWRMIIILTQEEKSDGSLNGEEEELEEEVMHWSGAALVG